MPTIEETRRANQVLLDYLTTPGMEKRAVDAVHDFTRLKIREEGFYRKILPQIPISDEDLDLAVDTDKPMKIVEKEPDNPPAITVPFASLPMNMYIYGPRYRVLFERILSPRFTKDINELRTYRMDIRQVLSDNAIKDMLAAEDGAFLTAVDTALVGPNVVVPTSNEVQWATIPGGLTRTNVVESMKILRRTPSNLPVNTVLVNHVSVYDILKWGRDEMGGDLSQDMLRNGWGELEFLNARWLVTIKRNLVPDNTVYYFAEPKFVGKSFLLEDITMYIESKAYFIEFFAYETIGGAIGNTNSLARVDFV